MRSACAAAAPPTWVTTPLSAVDAGSVESRRRVTSSAVRGSPGRVVGVTCQRTVRASSASCAGPTAATPWVCPRVAVTASTRLSDGPGAAVGRDAVTWSGPLMPGPKASASRSAAIRLSVPAALSPASSCPNVNPAAGAASTAISARPQSR